MDNRQILQTTGLTLLAITTVAGLGVLLVRDQISRHRRELFNPHPVRRLAALSYLSGEDASVDTVLLLRDYMAWERRPLLRKRAAAILARMEDALAARALVAEAF